MRETISLPTVTVDREKLLDLLEATASIDAWLADFGKWKAIRPDGEAEATIDTLFAALARKIDNAEAYFNNDDFNRQIGWSPAE